LLFAPLSGRCRHPGRRSGGRQDLRGRRGRRRHRDRGGGVLLGGNGPGRRRSRPFGEAQLLQQIRIEHDNGHREDEEEDDALFHDDSSSADWVVAPRKKRMALEQAPRRQDEAPRQTMAHQRLARVSRARGHESAAGRTERREPPLREADQSHDESGHWVYPETNSFARAKSACQLSRRYWAGSVTDSRFGKINRSSPAGSL